MIRVLVPGFLHMAEIFFNGISSFRIAWKDGDSLIILSF